MSWQTEMVQLLRYVINDIDSPTTYSDSRLQTTLVTAAQFLTFDVDFDETFTLDVTVPSISPDPTTPTRHEGFINLTVLQAACFIMAAEVKLNSGKALMIKDGPSTIDLRDTFKAYQQRYTDMCDKLMQAKMQYQMGNSKAGQAILTPYIQLDDPTYPLNFT